MSSLKRVSFNVAKAIKEAGYPQGVLPQIHKVKSFPMYYNGDFTPSYDYFFANYITTFDYNLCIACPTYLEVWLWLWREKNINLSAIYWNSDKSWHIAGFIKDKFNDPEEAIIAAIEYLVDNDLIK